MKSQTTHCNHQSTLRFCILLLLAIAIGNPINATTASAQETKEPLGSLRALSQRLILLDSQKIQEGETLTRISERHDFRLIESKLKLSELTMDSTAVSLITVADRQFAALVLKNKFNEYLIENRENELAASFLLLGDSGLALIVQIVVDNLSSTHILNTFGMINLLLDNIPKACAKNTSRIHKQD